ncbi:protein of unknown function [Paenibacillus alvei]|uniref:Uncharacterized protein n=1 Tax=Paenibacillus alvei TaxID=44250 RepID=A0A383RGX8_PAEAL|nr:protein of unknown function [Paenibacillus alvei]
MIDIDELGKVIVSLQAGELFTTLFEQAVYNSFMPLFELAGETELSVLIQRKHGQYKARPLVGLHASY